MQKNKWKIISFVTIGVGVVLVVIGLLWGGHPGFYVNAGGIYGLSQTVNESILQEKTPLEAFKEADISISNTSVEIIPSDDFYIEYAFSGKEDRPIIEVKDGKLTIREKSGISLYIFSFDFGIGGFAKQQYVKLYIPKEHILTKLAMEVEYGDINLGNLQGKELKVKQNDGKLTLKSIEAATIEIEREYGDSSLADVTAQKIKMRGHDGELKLEEIDSDNIDIQNEYGDIQLGLTQKLESYNLQLSTEYGSIKIPDTKINGDSDEQSYNVDNQSKQLIRIHCEDGNVEFTRK